jgi:hypothetical protein
MTKSNNSGTPSVKCGLSFSEDAMKADAQLIARLTAHRLAYVALIKALEKNSLVDGKVIIGVLRGIGDIQGPTEGVIEGVMGQFLKDELDAIIGSLEHGGSWTPTVIPGGRK